MSNDRRAQLNVWEDKEEEDEALEIDYQALMEWWKNNPIPKPFLVYETFEMITKAKFWVWYLPDQVQDKRILDMKDFLQHNIFYNEEDEKSFSKSQKLDHKTIKPEPTEDKPVSLLYQKLFGRNIKHSLGVCIK
ncbi:MAG: hypothetical protein LUQ26_00620 [Methylococcaceae bacterium]|jgi:hypothetical protein|nr:hypothetical protein [Methylococcaceae bacterium]